MKKIIISLLVICLPVLIMAQSSAHSPKVLIKELQGEYKGKTKRGLAHGQGIAQGTDTYSGHFKKGLPNGNGKYTWSTGEVYDGKWVDGKREGFGTYYFKDKEGKDSFFEGFWANDEYLGKNLRNQEYKIIQRRNVDKVMVKKRGQGNTVTVKFLRSGNNSFHSIKNLRYSFISGTVITGGTISGIENVEFPFKLRVDFTAPGKFRKMTNAGEDHQSMDIQRWTELEIFEPGNWEVSITF